MRITGSFIVVLIAFFCLTHSKGNAIDQTPLVATCSAATTVQVFSSLVFIDLISAHDPEVVFGLNMPSISAAEKIYKLNKHILEADFHLPHAADIASTFAGAASLVDEFTLPLHYLNTATVYGDYLVEKGVLSCDNVIELATEFFEYEQKEFQILELDPTRLESYVEGVIQSWGDQLDVNGYNPDEEEHWKILADWLYKKYESQIQEKR